MEPSVDELADIVHDFFVGCVFGPPGSGIVDEVDALATGWFEEGADAVLVGFHTHE